MLENHLCPACFIVVQQPSAALPATELAEKT